jgi:flagellar basal-body rod protein FlgB
MGQKIDPSDLLRMGMRVEALRQKVIANNIANLGTPGYERKEVRFQGLLARALETGDPEAVADIQPEVITPRASATVQEINNVNLEQEIGDLVKNSSNYKIYAALAKKLGSHKRLAIDDKF